MTIFYEFCEDSSGTLAGMLSAFTWISEFQNDVIDIKYWCEKSLLSEFWTAKIYLIHNIWKIY